MPRPTTGTARASTSNVLLYNGDLAANTVSLVLDPAQRMNRAAKNEPPDFISDHWYGCAA
jgi:hypothetical protein